MHELRRITAMNFFISKRSAPVDAPTVGLTRSEREAFSELAASFGRRRSLRSRAARALRPRGPLVGAAVWLSGAVWILSWLTTSVMICALGVLPYVYGMVSVVRTPHGAQRLRSALHRFFTGRPPADPARQG
jgi:hypothetical protein